MISRNKRAQVLLTESQRRRARWRWLTIIVVVIVCAFIAERFIFNWGVSATLTDPKIEFARPGTETAGAFRRSSDFSKFTHSSDAHSRLPCLLCHRRDSNAPVPKLPGHTPCAGCHAQEFANSGSPICAICHSNTQLGVVKAFPKLKSFNVKFDHAKHVGAGRSSAQCATCHKPERRGVSLSIPGGPGGHSTCFQCHGPRALGQGGQDIASCSTCHSMAGYSRTSEGSRAYSMSFSHVKHGSGKKLTCNSCHSIRAGMPQKRQVASPLPAMHAASPNARSCMSCHDDKRAFGVTNSSDCKRCHQGTTWRMGSAGSGE